MIIKAEFGKHKELSTYVVLDGETEIETVTSEEPWSKQAMLLFELSQKHGSAIVVGSTENIGVAVFRFLRNAGVPIEETFTLCLPDQQIIDRAEEIIPAIKSGDIQAMIEAATLMLLSDNDVLNDLALAMLEQAESGNVHATRIIWVMNNLLPPCWDSPILDLFWDDADRQHDSDAAMKYSPGDHDRHDACHDCKEYLGCWKIGTFEHAMINAVEKAQRFSKMHVICGEEIEKITGNTDTDWPTNPRVSMTPLLYVTYEEDATDES